MTTGEARLQTAKRTVQLYWILDADRFTHFDDIVAAADRIPVGCSPRTIRRSLAALVDLQLAESHAGKYRRRIIPPDWLIKAKQEKSKP